MAKTSKPKDPKPSKDPRMNNAYMTWVGEVREAVIALIQKSDTPPREIAADAKVCVTTLHNFINGKTMAPRADTLFGLTRALDIPFGIPDSFKKRHRLGGR